MQLDLSTIRAAETPVARTFQPSEAAAPDDAYRLAGPAELRMVVHRDKDRFRLAGTLSASLELPCSRCVEPFALPVETSFDLRYLPAAENAAPDDDGDDEIEVEEDDLSTAFYRDDAIDLSQLVREQIYLALPMKPLCSETCQGLCSSCGTNLNTGTCECRAEWVDPRLAALAKLKQKS